MRAKQNVSWIKQKKTHYFENVGLNHLSGAGNKSPPKRTKYIVVTSDGSSSISCEVALKLGVEETVVSLSGIFLRNFWRIVWLGGGPVAKELFRKFRKYISNSGLREY